MSGYRETEQSPHRQPPQMAEHTYGGSNGGYTNPAFSQNQAYEAPSYPSQFPGRTPLRHQASVEQSYGHGHGQQQQPGPQSRSLGGGSDSGYYDGGARGYSQPHPREVSPARSRGIPEDNGDYNYGHQQHQQQQSRALLPHQESWDNHSHNGTQHHPGQYQEHQMQQGPPMRQLHQYQSQETLHSNRPPLPGAPYFDSRSPSAPPAATLDRQQGVGSRNSGRASSVNLGYYSDSPYQRYSTHWNPETTGLSSADLSLEAIRRNSQDSDDEELNRGKRNTPRVGAMGLGGVFGGKKAETASNASGSGGANSGLLSSAPMNRGPPQESAWLQEQNKASKKTKWIIGGVILVVLLLIGGGVAAGVILSRRNSGGNSGGSSTKSVNPEEDRPDAPHLGSDADSIRGLLNNPDLHKSFYGMDYTPLNGVFPECLKWPATQNNITKDIAVISQLTTRLRMYGNDCNQTQMVIEAIKILNVDLQVWMGVYIDANETTNARQLSQMYDILEEYGEDPFAGVVLANEALFRKEITEWSLVDLLGKVRTNFTELGYNKLNISTSDLGSAWTTTLAGAVDTLMANVHPFFAGVTVEDAPGWTWEFTDNNNYAIARQTLNNPNVIVSEVGWPSGGGTNMGSVAGIDEMNDFLQNYVCEANKNGTEYFWFVPFDEPWKERYNEPGKEWETQWGLMDVNRNLKPGVKIPDCPSR